MEEAKNPCSNSQGIRARRDTSLTRMSGGGGALAVRCRKPMGTSSTITPSSPPYQCPVRASSPVLNGYGERMKEIRSRPDNISGSSQNEGGMFALRALRTSSNMVSHRPEPSSPLIARGGVKAHHAHENAWLAGTRFSNASHRPTRCRPRLPAGPIVQCS